MSAAKHQIFISSTYADLIPERQQLFMQTYRLGHIPIGMEGFVASNMTQWDYIHRRITECDYFATVVAHRYGSLMPNGSGTSFTEAEYELAVRLGKPVLRFVLRESTPWPGGEPYRESDRGAQERLVGFKRRLLESNLVGQWTTKEDLAAGYSAAITELIRTDPRGGLYPAEAHPQFVELGLRAITVHSNSTDHSAVLNSPGPVTIVLNDGYHFVPKYAPILESRIRRGEQTRVLLVHPTSRNLELIARKSNKGVAQQRADILASVARLKSLRRPGASQGLLQCRGHEYINAYTASLSTSLAIVSLYFTRVRSNELTTFLLEPSHNGLHARYAEDIDQLWREVESNPESDLFELVE